ncbi:ABC transporter ATP-binding protein [Deinococcus roseus]|uniref:Sugar ABC transporter ATP-binding protein n=1 Tax=Deinococcus roseus TaxID=392414 RepID=A0ABQ2CWX8_9DEIO|nr:ATP-binding cassette domain-containing protein [Deinococcus roseus]GGJ21786.1 sugar ABC transporter ATP-binding protein [Deinococcus roseus]
MEPLPIDVRNLQKTFAIPRKEPGLLGAVKGLFKPEYQYKTAVNGLSFQVGKGEVVGYIGVNGAGKSTTIKILTGILAPTGGQVRILGRDPFKNRVANAKDIGVVFGQRTQLWWDLALIESLRLIARMYDVPESRYKTLLEEFSHLLDLDELLSKPIRTMSLGQKMRAELAATLIHEPKIVYLDEPTIGLDIMAKQRIRDFIKKQSQERDVTVLLTTHDLGDIEELCQRIIIIDNGHIIYDGQLSTIKNHFGTHRTITFETAETLNTSRLLLPKGSELLSAEGNKLVLKFNRSEASASLVAAQVMQQLEVQDFQLQEPDLTSIISQIYQGALHREKVMG